MVPQDPAYISKLKIDQFKSRDIFDSDKNMTA